MSRIRTFLSKWTAFDQLAAAYSQPVFERVMAKHGFGRRGVTALAIFGGAVAIAFSLGAGALLATAAKDRYLQSYGREAAAAVTHRSFTTTTGKHGTKTVWQTLDYRFTTRSGEPIAARFSRPLAEFAAAHRGNAFTVVYWSEFPSINQPKGMRSEVPIILFLATMLALFVAHLLLLVGRLWRWREVVDAGERGGAALRAAA